MTIKDGGPAFAVPQRLDGCGMPRDDVYPGMSLRQFYKAHALEGLLSGPANKQIGRNVKLAVEYAVRMLAEDAEFAQKESQS